MDSLPQQLVKKVAVTVAIERGLPWHLEELWRGARRGLDKARAESSTADKLGWKFQDFCRAVVFAGARQAADEIKAKAAPTEDRIRAALETFSADQWIHFITKSKRDDREALRKFILANLADLEQNLDLDKLQAIRGAIGMHAAQTALRGSGKWICVTNAHWALVLHDIARYHYKALDPPPPGTRSWDDMTRPKAIGEKLGISRYRTENMLKRMQEKPLHEFSAEHGGDFLDYWLWATGPRAYERRRKSTG